MRIAARRDVVLSGHADRPAGLVRLFSSILKREDDKYFLVTPVEKVGIRVDDAPFLAVEMTAEGRRARPAAAVSAPMSTTGSHAMLRIACVSSLPAPAGSRPICTSGDDLWAKVTRPLYYDLVELGEERMIDGREMFGVTSSGAFFAMAPAEQVRDAL